MCNRCHGLFSFVHMPGVFVPILLTLCQQSLCIDGNKRVEDFAILGENIACICLPTCTEFAHTCQQPFPKSPQITLHSSFFLTSQWKVAKTMLSIFSNGEGSRVHRKRSLNMWSELCRLLPLLSAPPLCPHEPSAPLPCKTAYLFASYQLSLATNLSPVLSHALFSDALSILW